MAYLYCQDDVANVTHTDVSDSYCDNFVTVTWY